MEKISEKEYVFECKDDGENIVNNLRDSSFRIKQSFLNTEKNKISYYLNDSEEG